MASRTTSLGDSHNFGRRVSTRAGRVHKPRTVTWERLLLSARSPLRRALDAAAASEGGAETFGFLPRLAFTGARAKHSGVVEHVALEPLPRLTAEGRRALARVVGRATALFSWLGLADLHWENLALGVDAEGRMVFGPLDVEMILGDFALPTETKLLPDADPEYAVECQHAAGVRRALPFLGKPIALGDLVAMAAAYRATLELLDRHAPSLARAFDDASGIADAPIRVCLRGTGDYVRARAEPVWPPLLDAEAEQLDRGDIPYFFRRLGEPGLFWFGDASLRTARRLPTRGDVPRLEPLLSPARDLRSPSRRSLREEGLFALLGAFDHPTLEGTHAADGLGVAFRRRALVVTLPSGEVLESRRALGAFVSSVYLPCRCGEVRAVLVPRVTRCAAAPDSNVRAAASRDSRRAP